MEYTSVDGSIDFGVFYNVGDGSFRDEVLWNVSPEFPLASPGVADFNGDGVDDLATLTVLNPNTSKKAYALEVFTGTRSLSFDGPAAYPLVAAPSLQAVLTGDFNGDGKPDLAMVMGGAGAEIPLDSIQVRVFENLGDGTFGTPASYVLSGRITDYASGFAVGDFNRDGVDDIAVGTTEQTASDPSAVNLLLSTCD